MNGFTIKHNDKELHIALPTGGVTLLIINKEGKFNIHCQGMDRDATFYSWHEEELKTGDTVTLCYGEQDAATISQPIYVHKRESQISEDQELLANYHKMKQELMDEGLL